MPNFKKYSYSQSAMVAIDFEEQLQPGTFEFTLHKLIDNHIDLSAFHEKYSNDSGGRSAYDPAISFKDNPFLLTPKASPQAARSSGNVSTTSSSKRCPAIPCRTSPASPVFQQPASELDLTTTQNAILSLGAIKALLPDEKMRITPRVIGIYNPVGGGAEFYERRHFCASGGPAVIVSTV